MPREAKKKASVTNDKNTRHQSKKYRKETADFEKIYNPKYRSREEKIIALMKDYTKNNNGVHRFFTGHWNRHHIEEVNAIVVLSRRKTAKNLMVDLKSVSLVNPKGTLATIIDFIDTKNSGQNDSDFGTSLQK